MNKERITGNPSRSDDPQGQVMKTPDDVVEMLRLKACGSGAKRIARELGCSHRTVRHYPGGRRRGAVQGGATRQAARRARGLAARALRPA